MPVTITVRFQVADVAKAIQSMTAHAEDLERITQDARSKGCLSHPIRRRPERTRGHRRMGVRRPIQVVLRGQRRDSGDLRRVGRDRTADGSCVRISRRTRELLGRRLSIAPGAHQSEASAAVPVPPGAVDDTDEPRRGGPLGVRAAPRRCRTDRARHLRHDRARGAPPGAPGQVISASESSVYRQPPDSRVADSGGSRTSGYRVVIPPFPQRHDDCEVAGIEEAEPGVGLTDRIARACLAARPPAARRAGRVHSRHRQRARSCGTGTRVAVPQ